MNGLFKKAILKALSQLQWGRIVLVESLETHSLGSADVGPNVQLTVHNDRFYESVALRGSVGAGESYMAGDWTCSNLTELTRIFVRNYDVLNQVDSSWLNSLSREVLRLYHRMRSNTRSGSRKNIAAHYDLGNDFYSLFLDETMTYSAGLFATPESTLKEASVAKLDRICKKLDLRPSDHLLEIGTGWGSFALHAARHYGCRVTTTTISGEQYAYAKTLIEKEGLTDQVNLLLSDYRDLNGQFDKIASIEMIEAVGWRYYRTFMKKCCDLLASDGLLAMQAITIQDQYYDSARKSVDFIQRYIFPGCCIPSTTALIDAATSASQLKLSHFEDMTPHYARTLATWRERFLARQEDVRALGFGDEFIRMWEFYLCYCEGGFTERHIGSVQMLFAKRDNRRAPILAPIQ